MSSELDLTVVTDAAWTAFRGRLADHVAAMDDDDVLVLEYAGLVDDDDEDEDGAAPYVQLCAFGDDLVQVEAASNSFLHPLHHLTDDDEAVLVELGWDEPLAEPGWENFHDTVERRDADRLAVMVVRTLREVYAVPHPAFLDAAGLEHDPDAPSPVTAPDETPDDEPVIAFPHGPEHLQELVDTSMREVFPDLVHDDDGDIPIRAGESLVFVRVLADRPCVELYAEIVLDPTDLERLATELVLLNGAHPMWKFAVRDGVVVMHHELLAVPFAPTQLRMLVERFVGEVDEIAHDLVARVGGHRFAETPSGATTPVDEDDLVMTGLLELLHLDRVRPTTVAGLFDHDRLEIIRQIVRIRRGAQSCGDHDEERVLHALRRALRVVSDGETREPGGRLPPRPRSVQPSLLADGDLGDDALDLGWPA